MKITGAEEEMATAIVGVTAAGGAGKAGGVGYNAGGRVATQVPAAVRLVKAKGCVKKIVRPAR